MAKSYKVVKPLVILRMQDGTRVHLYERHPVPDGADPLHVEQLLDEGFIADLGVPVPVVGDALATPTDEEVPAETPVQPARKRSS